MYTTPIIGNLFRSGNPVGPVNLSIYPSIFRQQLPERAGMKRMPGHGGLHVMSSCYSRYTGCRVHYPYQNFLSQGNCSVFLFLHPLSIVICVAYRKTDQLSEPMNRQKPVANRYYNIIISNQQ
jgi:hypothetical protein